MRPLARVLLLLACLAFGVMLLARLAYPLLWQDEGETAMFATRILAYGYPKVHDPQSGNVLYEFGPNVALGVKESLDAYIGRTWGDFYLAVPGVLWARSAPDDRTRTFRLRLPFALAGAAGLVALLWGVLPALPRERRTGFAAAAIALFAVSISLLLHLRQLRYYPWLVAVLGALLALHVRTVQGGERATGRRIALQAGLSFALFQLFHVGWFAATGLLVLDAALAARREPPGARRARALRWLAPYALAVLAVLPCLWFYETFAVAAGFARDQGLSLGGTLRNLGAVAMHFARHELLIPALGARLAVLALARGDERALRETRAARRLAARGWLFCVGYAAFGCVNPLVYERYFVVLSPILTLTFLLDVWSAWALAPQRLPAARGSRVHAGVAAAALAAVALALGLRAETLAGRIAEIRTPVRGPIDFAVAHLRERYADPARLVIATNYEAHPLMYYLGSRVIVGLSLNNIASERSLVPDVVIPRRAWPRPLPELRRFLSRASYEEVVLPVLDTHYNTIPALTPSPATPDPHRFRTPWAGPGTPGRLRIFHLRRDAPRDATPEAPPAAGSEAAR